MLSGVSPRFVYELFWNFWDSFKDYSMIYSWITPGFFGNVYGVSYRILSKIPGGILPRIPPEYTKGLLLDTFRDKSKILLEIKLYYDKYTNITGLRFQRKPWQPQYKYLFGWTESPPLRSSISLTAPRKPAAARELGLTKYHCNNNYRGICVHKTEQFTSVIIAP